MINNTMLQSLNLRTKAKDHFMAIVLVIKFLIIIQTLIKVREHPSRTSWLQRERGLPQWGHRGGSELIRTSPKHKTSLIETYFICHQHPSYFYNMLIKTMSLRK